MKISVIIVNWNTRELLLDCIDSVLAGADGADFQVIVLDNASSDGSVEAVRERFPQVHVIASDANLGFAAGNNLGLKQADGDYILLLNPDTIVPPGAMNSLVAFLEDHPDVGMVGPLIVGKDEKPQISAFGIRPSAKEAALRMMHIWRIAPRSRWARSFLITPKDDADWSYVEHLLGACMMVRGELLRSIGGFDDSFFLFLEETDLCIRIQESGYRIAYYTGTQIKHLGEQSMQGILDKSGGLYIRSYNRFCRKHGVTADKLIAANLFMMASVFVDALVGLVKHRSFARMCRSLGSLWYGYFREPIVR